jgi:chitinase
MTARPHIRSPDAGTGARVSRRLFLAAACGLAAGACTAQLPGTPRAASATEIPQPAAAISSSTASSTAAPTSVAKPSPAPRRHVAIPQNVVGGYWPLWQTDGPSLRDVPAEYNVIYVFSAMPSGVPGEMVLRPFGNADQTVTGFAEDVAHCRTVQGRSVLLSLGGAQAGVGFTSRSVSTAFVDSVRRVVDSLGGVDGVDLNTFEGDQVPDVREYSWISGKLKDVYGPQFAVVCPPAPWRDTDKVFCKQMVAAGMIDLCGPQFYDGVGLATVDSITGGIAEWVDLVGAEHLCVGFGVGASGDYMTAEQCAAAWKAVVGRYPTLRGANIWSIPADQSAGWRFATLVGRSIASR